MFSGCMNEPLTFALRQEFHPSIVASTVNAHPHQPSPEERDNATHQAITAIQEQIKTKTDPLTLLLRELVGDTDPPQP